MEFGKTLREAREAKGYTIAQIAEMTRLMSSVIESLENENFSKIAAPIYGRGFVKLYCEALGIDSKALVAEFMEIYNGNRDLGIKERPVVAPEPPPAIDTPLCSDIEREVSKSQNGEVADFTNASVQEELPKSDDEPKLSRYASPVREYKPRVPVSLPSNFWRVAVLAVVTILVVWVICLGVGALYRATSGETAQEEVVDVAQKDSTNVPSENKPNLNVQSREKIAIPAFYIDNKIQ